MDAASPVDRCRGVIPTTDILKCQFHDDRFGVINGPDDPEESDFRSSPESLKSVRHFRFVPILLQKSVERRGEP